METLDPIVSIAVGLGLAAACGFRVFVPLLAVGIVARTGHLSLAPGFEWLATDPALLAFGVATLAEVGAYFVPWLHSVALTGGLANPAVAALELGGALTAVLAIALPLVALALVVGACFLLSLSGLAPPRFAPRTAHR